MTVREFIVKNPQFKVYHVKLGKKKYLTNLFETNSFFGEKMITKIKYDYKQIPNLTINQL